eukprot:3934132-Rhodomonas_salina.1
MKDMVRCASLPSLSTCRVAVCVHGGWWCGICGDEKVLFESYAEEEDEEEDDDDDDDDGDDC